MGLRVSGVVKKVEKRRPRIAGGKKGSPVDNEGFAKMRKRPQPMTYAGAALNIRFGLSGESFSARNQMPGGLC